MKGQKLKKAVVLTLLLMSINGYVFADEANDNEIVYDSGSTTAIYGGKSEGIEGTNGAQGTDLKVGEVGNPTDGQDGSDGTDAVESTNNKIIIKDGEYKAIYGGYSVGGAGGNGGRGGYNKDKNSLIPHANGGNGGNGGNGSDVINNYIEISKGTFNNNIYGGYTSGGEGGDGGNSGSSGSTNYGIGGNGGNAGNGGNGGNAIKNTIKIHDGIFKNYIYGAYSAGGKSGVGGQASGPSGDENRGETGESGTNGNAGNVTENKVYIENGSFTNNIVGGFGAYNDFNIDNSVTENYIEISDGNFEGSYGKYIAGGSSSGNGAVRDNEVLINGGIFEKYSVYGGYNGTSTENAAIQNNKITINGGKFNLSTGYKIAGGHTVSSQISNNKVTINNGTFIGSGNGAIYGSISNGGYGTGFEAEYYSVKDNVLELNGGTYNCDIYGGKAESSSVINNTVYIYSGDYNKTIYAASGNYKENEEDPDNAEKGLIKDNSIVLSVKEGLEKADLSEATLKGTDNKGSTIKKANNSLVIDGWSGKIKTIENFQNINFKNFEWQNGGTVIEIVQGNTESYLKDTNINLNNLTFAGGSNIQEQESMSLIKNSSPYDFIKPDIDINKVQESADFTAGVAKVGTGETSINENGDLIYTITSVKQNNQTKLVAENRAVAAAFINQGTDLIADSLDTISRDGKYGIKTFAAVHGNRSKYDVNSDIKINGWSTIVGVGSENEHNGGDFSWGVFYENGSGNYRTYNEFNNEFFRGDGSLVYNGGGIAARYENAHGVYTEGSLRAGMLKSEMTDALSDGENKYGYKIESEYYGAHIGIGQIIPLSESSDLDVYGKFFHTYTEGDSFNVAGDEFEFDSINSDRLRVGARLTTNKENKFSTYYGLAYEYEFNGDAEMRAAGMDAPTQSLQGSSYMAEIGLNYQPTPDSPWSFELNMRGYAGEREGATFNVQATYTF